MLVGATVCNSEKAACQTGTTDPLRRHNIGFKQVGVGPTQTGANVDLHPDYPVKRRFSRCDVQRVDCVRCDEVDLKVAWCSIGKVKVVSILLW